MSKLLGITGTIASGKSSVGNILQSLGITVVDTDKLVHDLLDNSESVKARVRERFGTIERNKLSEFVFSDKNAKKDLEAILHPEVITACRKIARELKDESVIAFLVPLLFEANLEKEYEQIWSVRVNEETLRKRLKARNNYSDAEIDARLSNQLSQEIKSDKAHYTIDNSGTLDETKIQVENLLQNLLKTC